MLNDRRLDRIDSLGLHADARSLGMQIRCLQELANQQAREIESLQNGVKCNCGECPTLQELERAADL
jgi:hypothetical protein